MSEHKMKDALTKVAALVKSEEFKKASTEFVAKHCGAFGFDDENKLEYTAIHEEYQEMIEANIVEQLADTVDFEMLLGNLQGFMKKKPELTPDVAEALDMLTSLTEFQDFKDMMLMAKKDRDATANLEGLNTIADVDFGVAGVQNMFEEMASASGEDGWKVEVDKKWWKVESKMLKDGFQYNRSGLLVDMNMDDTMEMMMGYENPRMQEWLDHMKSMEVVKELGPGDSILKAEMNFKGLMSMALAAANFPATVHLRMIRKDDFPEKGEVTVGQIPWDMEKDSCLTGSQFFKIRSVCIKPYQGSANQTLITTIENSSLTWLPTWMRNLMFATIAPKMMSGIVSKYKKYKSSTK